MTPIELQKILSKQPEFPSWGAIIATAIIAIPIHHIVNISGVQKILAEVPLLLDYFEPVSIILLFIFFLSRNYLSKIKECNSLIKFTYDGNGVLWHGNECNIALRDVTFLKLLNDISKEIPDEKDKKKIFLNAGCDMGRGFGRQFKSQIYPKEIMKKDIPFNQLPKNERLRLWAEYDSSTGWGLISEIDIGRSLYVTAKHPTLFDAETGGECFSYIMAGYAESFVNEIISDIGIHYKFSGDIEIDDNEKISFHLTNVH